MVEIPRSGNDMLSKLQLVQVHLAYDRHRYMQCKVRTTPGRLPLLLRQDEEEDGKPPLSDACSACRSEHEAHAETSLIV